MRYGGYTAGRGLFADDPDGAAFEYRWAGFNELEAINLQPKFIIQFIKNIPVQTVRYVDNCLPEA